MVTSHLEYPGPSRILTIACWLFATADWAINNVRRVDISLAALLIAMKSDFEKSSGPALRKVIPCFSQAPRVKFHPATSVVQKVTWCPRSTSSPPIPSSGNIWPMAGGATSRMDRTLWSLATSTASVSPTVIQKPTHRNTPSSQDISSNYTISAAQTQAHYVRCSSNGYNHQTIHHRPIDSTKIRNIK